jgi:tRNA pseudouridine55 synthase
MMATEAVRKDDAPDEGTVLLIDKPLNWTSFDVIHRLRQTLGIAKAGHAGTLDPRATGLLIVCTGKQTKRIDQFTGLEKEYTGLFELGIRTPSFDMETGVTQRSDYSSVNETVLGSVVKRFLGPQLQVPPMYSAAKHRGKPLYKYARKGKTLERQAKEIDVREFSIQSFAPPMVGFRIVCSKGTYIRSLVNDIGEALGCGATLNTLRRTRIGEFRVEDAMTVEQLDKLRNDTGILKTESDGYRIPA